MKAISVSAPDHSTCLADIIRCAALRLRGKILGLDLEALAISDYTRFYLKNKVQYLDYVLELYGNILSLALTGGASPIDRRVFVDYGGGTGLLAFLARELGVGTVIYNDIYGVLCKDMAALAGALSLPLDHIVCGDVDELIEYSRTQCLEINVIASYDVLEHIYDVGSHFQNLARLAHDDFQAVYASGANIRNYRYVRRIKKIQLAAEYENRKNRAEITDRSDNFNLRAFVQVRQEIISEYDPQLGPEKVELLARATRGLRREDIQACVDEYQRTGSISYRPDHPTNTCDPDTGYWAEHLMKTRWLRRTVHAAGFNLQVFPGYYPLAGSRRKAGLKVLLNSVIRLLGGWGLFLSPYYCIRATPLNVPARKNQKIKTTSGA